MLGIGHGLLNGADEAPQVDGGSGSQVRIRSLAAFVDRAAAQLLYRLTLGVPGQGSSLLVPLVLSARVLFHAVILAQLVLGQHLSGHIRSDGAGCVKGNGCGNAVDLAGLDHPCLVHGNSHDGHIVFDFALPAVGSGSAVADIGADVQSGLDRTF